MTRENRKSKGGSRAKPPGIVPAPFNPEEILATLIHHGVQFVVIGAYAAVTQGWPELTTDVDITPNRGVRNLQRLTEALLEMDAKVLTPEGEINESWPIDDQHLRLRETTFLTTRFGDVDIVINPAAADGYPDLSRPGESYRLSVGGVSVRIAKLERVIASKRASDRPKDRDALPRLEARLRRNRRSQK
jgi:hypothetical protein